MRAGDRDEDAGASSQARTLGRRKQPSTATPPRVIGYLSDFVGLCGNIERQQALVGPLLASRACGAPGYVIDVGWPDTAASCPPALFAILRRARLRLVDVIVVEDVGRFARNDATAVRIAEMMCDVGVQILEARMRPTPAPRDLNACRPIRRAIARRDGHVPAPSSASASAGDSA